VKRTETELIAILLEAAKSGSTKNDIARMMKLSAKSVDRYLTRSVNRGMLFEEDGNLRISSKGERFLAEYGRFQVYRKEYLRRLKLLKEMLPTTRSKKALN
jgi:predicted transcriptional regulator